MVHLTLVHGNDVFNRNEFRGWVKKYFPTAKFDSFKWNRWYPTIKIHYDEFTDNHKNLPQWVQNKIAGIKCNPNLIEFLSCGVHPINKITNLHPDFEKYTGRDRYGNSVEEVIEINEDNKAGRVIKIN